MLHGDAKQLRAILLQIIADEHRANPFTDIGLIAELKSHGFTIAIGALQYHRLVLNIPGAPTRRKNYLKQTKPKKGK